MCGLTGAAAKTAAGNGYLERIREATECLARRGPDASGTSRHGPLVLGHRRLSVIDTSAAAAQPMRDASGRYEIVFNGEFFNYREHRERLLREGCPLRTGSDTEVLLNLYAQEGPACLRHVNGFFALALYDAREETLFLARDRFGVKPLLIYEDADALLFASEMKALLRFGIPRTLDRGALLAFLQLNYVPAPAAILQGVRKLEPGMQLLYSVKERRILQEERYYRLPFPEPARRITDRAEAAARLYNTLDAAVQRRLVSDVPLGAFLSGGTDSSIVSALAARHTGALKTFSIGFTDEPFYDETPFAQRVARHIGAAHTVFPVTNADLLGVLHDVLDYIDEPFADASALNVFLLSRRTRQAVTVALSGDGGDELFAGYNKHYAEWTLRRRRALAPALALLHPLLRPFHGSRHTPAGNRLRQLRRFAEGARLGPVQRYWRWCGIASETDAAQLLRPFDPAQYPEWKKHWLAPLAGAADFNRILYADVHLILHGDMLAKVDLMSMANSLEVRTPFLDYEVAELAFALPEPFKIGAAGQKLILKEAFGHLLPPGILQRAKKGFEVPLLTWFRTDLRPLITEDLLSDDFVASQGLFNPAEVRKLKRRLFSAQPGEIEARMWGLVVFQSWWKRYMA
jgi:asparagine synthase (glutamine-hydrolysing)